MGPRSFNRGNARFFHPPEKNEILQCGQRVDCQSYLEYNGRGGDVNTLPDPPKKKEMNVTRLLDRASCLLAQ